MIALLLDQVKQLAISNSCKINIEFQVTKNFIKLYKRFEMPDKSFRTKSKKIELTNEELNNYDIAKLMKEVFLFNNLA